jgi:hypothetical protein
MQVVSPSYSHRYTPDAAVMQTEAQNHKKKLHVSERTYEPDSTRFFALITSSKVGFLMASDGTFFILSRIRDIKFILIIPE